MQSPPPAQVSVQDAPVAHAQLPPSHEKPLVAGASPPASAPGADEEEEPPQAKRQETNGSTARSRAFAMLRGVPGGGADGKERLDLYSRTIPRFRATDGVGGVADDGAPRRPIDTREPAIALGAQGTPFTVTVAPRRSTSTLDTPFA
jgi:hypothetical protein